MGLGTGTWLGVDKFVGGPLVFAADLLSWFLNRLDLRKKGNRVPTDRILLMKFMGMGSIVQALPLVTSLRRCNPTATITFLTFSENRPFVELVALFDRVYYVDRSSVPQLLLSTLRAIWRIRKDGIQVSIDLEVYSHYSRLLSFAIFSPHRLGFFLINKRAHSNIFTKTLYFNRFQHISAVYRNMALLAGVPEESLPREGENSNTLVLTQEHYREVDDLYRGIGVGTHAFEVIAVNVNASDLCLERRWPAEHFAQVIRDLAARTGTVVLLIGSRGERRYIDALLHATGLSGREGVVNIAGTLSFGAFLALLQRCDLLVTNDSGPMHFGALMGCPLVSLWGPGTPQSYGPVSPNSRVVYHALYCSPCLYMVNNRPCGGSNECMQAITPREVLSACEEVLGVGHA